MKAYCIWCEIGNCNTKNGYLWIHQRCADELMDISQDIKSIRKILEGIHPRNNIDEDNLNTVKKFIDDMQDFRRRWDNSMKIITQIKDGNNK
jgi:hypothetical protein